MFNKIIRIMWKPLVIGLLVALVVTLSPVGLQFNTPPQDVSSPDLTLGQYQVVLTIGTEVYAAGTADYTCDGVADDVQFQAALDALPVGGGKLVALTGDYVFAATVARAIDDVTIDGMGDSTYFAFDGATALFDAGTQNGWVFRNFRTDAGGVDVSGTEDYVITNVTVGTIVIGKITRTATFVVAANDSSASSKAQADYVCSGANDHVEIQAALDALPATGGYIFLLDGTYILGVQVVRAIDDVKFMGCGQATLLTLDGGTAVITAGAQDGWLFKDFATDAGGPAIGGATQSAIRNVWIAGVRTDDPAGGGGDATITVAANDTLAALKGRADVVCSGAADDVEINAALTTIAGGRCLLLEGTFNCVANIVVPANTKLEGQGFGTILNFDDTGAGTVTNAGAITINGDNVHVFNLKAQLTAGCGTGGTRPNLITAVSRTKVWLQNLWLVGDQSVADDGSQQRQCSILFTTVTDSKIVACRSEDNDRHGIALDTSSDYNTISDNTCEGNNYNGIYIDAASYNTIIGNIGKGNIWNGIYLYIGSDYNTISGNVCEGNSQSGIYLDDTTDHNTVSGNTCNNNTMQGIFLITVQDCTISSNTCTENGRNGVLLDNCGDNTFTGNTLNRNDYSGIHVQNTSTGNTITGNTCSYNLRMGIYLYGCPNNTITGNTCIWNDGVGTTYSGIHINQSYETTITGNRIDSSGVHGIYLQRCLHCTVSGNISDDNKQDGINLTGDGTANCDYNEVSGNVCYSNASHGIEIAGGADANKNRVINNKLVANTTAEFADGGTDTELATYVVLFVDGTDPQDAGYLIDANTEMARAYLRLPPEVQQVVRMVVYAEAKTAETHEMELEMVITGAADNEPTATHNGSVANLDSVSVNFAANDIIHWVNTEAGTLALVGGDSVRVKVLHEAVEGDNLDTQAYFRTVEIQYV